MKYEVAIADDHLLFTSSFELLVNSFRKFKVSFGVHSGPALQEKLSKASRLPDILLLDVSMPEMSGAEIAHWVNENYPTIKVAAVTMNDAPNVVWSMVAAGCCSYLLKGMHPTKFEKALEEIAVKGYYNADATNINFRRLLQAQQDVVVLTEKELQFLQHACSDDSYSMIAEKMNVSPSTVDGYRCNIFKKFNVESRTGMVLEGIRRGFIKI